MTPQERRAAADGRKVENPRGGQPLDRIGERYEVDASIELVVPGKKRFRNKEQVLHIRIRNISVSGALLVVPSEAQVRVGLEVVVRQGPRSVPMKVVRIQPALDPGYELVGIGAPPNDRAWGEFVAAMIPGPDAPTGLRWLNSVR